MTKPEMTEVDSSVIGAHGYNPESQKMHVKFKTGDTWEYYGVSPEKYAAFTGAHSHGAFFLKKVKAQHTGKKVG